MACLSGPNIEVSRLSLDATFKAWTSGMDPMGSSILKRSYCELEWQSRDVNISVHDADRVNAKLVWHEVDLVKAILDFSHDGLFNLQQVYPLSNIESKQTFWTYQVPEN